MAVSRHPMSVTAHQLYEIERYRLEFQRLIYTKSIFTMTYRIGPIIATGNYKGGVSISRITNAHQQRVNLPMVDGRKANHSSSISSIDSVRASGAAMGRGVEKTEGNQARTSWDTN